MKNISIILVSVFFLITNIFSQTQEAKTFDDKIVELHSDGTWQYKVIDVESSQDTSFTPNIISCNGPEGCDATALYKDSNGVLWLGTGSSGGVYKYDKAQNIWIEYDENIGPVHVNNIIEIDKILIVAIDSIDNNFQFHSQRFYYLEGKTWKPVNENQYSLIKSEIYNDSIQKMEEIKNDTIPLSV